MLIKILCNQQYSHNGTFKISWRCPLSTNARGLYFLLLYYLVIDFLFFKQVPPDWVIENADDDMDIDERKGETQTDQRKVHESEYYEDDKDNDEE